LTGALCVQDVGRAHGGLAGEQVVDFEADSVERKIEPGVCRKGEGKRMHQMRSVAQHDRALVEGLVDEVDLSAGQVADAAVDQLGGAAGGGLGEVTGFDEGGAVAAGRGVYRDAERRLRRRR
jgi:hypothetical protein